MRECTIPGRLQVVANAFDARRINRAGGDLKTAPTARNFGHQVAHARLFDNGASRIVRASRRAVQA